MKTLFFLLLLIIPILSEAQKKIKNAIVLSTNDTVNINDDVTLLKGTDSNNIFKYVHTRSNYNVTSQFEGVSQRISYFKIIDSAFYAYTFNFEINLLGALNSNEIAIKGLKSNITIQTRSSLTSKNNTFIEILANIPWNKPQQEINNFYGEQLKSITKKSYGNDGFCESYLPEIYIGNHKMHMDLVLDNTYQNLSRVNLKPIIKLTSKNFNIVKNDVTNTLESIFGKPLTILKDSSIKIHSHIIYWLTDSYCAKSVFLNGENYHACAVDIQPINKKNTDLGKLNCIISKNTYLNSKPNFSGEKIINVFESDIVNLIDISESGYLYVKFKDKNGYLLKNEVYNSKELDSIFKNKMMFYKIKSLKRDSIVLDSINRQIKIRNAQLIQKYGKNNGTLVIQKKIKIGMTKDMCIDAWGKPNDINRTTGSWGTHEQWIYNNDCYLYFENGILTTIQN